MKRIAILLLIAACSDTTPTGTNLLNLDRPVDIAFACFGGLRVTNGQPPTADQTVTVSAQPTASCDKRSEDPGVGSNGLPNPPPTPPGQEKIDGGTLISDTSWYAFILQSESGTVAIATWLTKPSTAFMGGDVSVQDANKLTPGQNSISVGQNPVAIGTDVTGCKEVIANAGSCDMSILDVTSALSNGQTAIVDRLDITTPNGGKLRSKPSAMQMQPPGGTIGVTCPAGATGLAYVAYPSCHAVAAVDTATGVVQQAITFDASGVPTIVPDGNISCPDECGGAAVTAGTRPVTLSLLLDTRVDREVLAIGADNSNVVTVVELDPTTSLPLSISSRIPLVDPSANLGVTSIAVSPQIGMGGAQSVINDDTATGGQSQFVYAVATDNTIRVADILTLNKECDAQVDPRYLHDVTNVKTLSCMPVGDPATPPRRAGARGPGIELIGDAIPTSVAITRVDPVTRDLRDKGPLRLIGYFAFATAANGATYVINIDNDDFADFVDPEDPLGTQIPLDIAHQLRDSVPFRGLLATEIDPNDPQMKKTVPVCDAAPPDPDASSGPEGGARSTDQPGLTLPSGSLAAEKVVVLPSIRQVDCVGADEKAGKPVAETEFAAPVMPVNIREQVFPDLRGLRGDETWTMTWEGSLSQDTADNAIDGPAVRESQMTVDAFGAHMVDQSKPYCDAGVEKYDIVQLRGCDPSLGDADCALGYTCFVHPQSKVPNLGACMLKDEADRLSNACKSFLTSLRRYTVSKSSTGQLDLLPRKHVLRTSPVDGCTDDAQCQTLANYAARLPSGLNPVDDKTPPDPHMWSCRIDPDRAPIAGTGKRCIEACATDADCDDGTVCDGGTCMESVIPPQACVNAGQRYELRAGEAFAVVGTKSGYIHPIIADAAGNCVKDPNANPTQIGRFPLNPPACDPTADPRTGALPGGGFEPNPCFETVDETEYQPNWTNLAGGSCVLGSTPRNLVMRPADAIKFRNRGMALDIVDPTYPGDAVCIGDRGANLGRIPSVPPGFQIVFRQTAGFNPLIVQIAPALPIKAVIGPTQSVWVIDEGDYLSTSISTPSTSGKVFRFEGQSVQTISVLE